MFIEQRLIYFKAPEEDPILNEGAVSVEAIIQDAKIAGPYLKSLAEIGVNLELGNMSNAWEVFYKTFIKNPSKTKEYVNLIARKWNVIQMMAKVPLVGIPYKIPAYILDRGADVADWTLDKISNVQVNDLFKGATAEWSKLTPEQKSEFEKIARDLFTIAVERGKTYLDINKTVNVKSA